MLADAHAHLVRAVGDHAPAELLHAREHAADGPRQIGELPEVAMSTGDRDHRAGRIDARALDEALVDGALETETPVRPGRERW